MPLDRQPLAIGSERPAAYCELVEVTRQGIKNCAFTSQDEKLNPPVAPPVTVLVGYGLAWPKANGRKPVGRDAALAGEETAHSGGALAREPLVPLSVAQTRCQRRAA